MQPCRRTTKFAAQTANFTNLNPAYMKIMSNEYRIFQLTDTSFYITIGGLVIELTWFGKPPFSGAALITNTRCLAAPLLLVPKHHRHLDGPVLRL